MCSISIDIAFTKYLHHMASHAGTKETAKVAIANVPLLQELKTG